MAVQEFGATVQRKVEPPLGGPEVYWTCKCIVDYRHQIVLLGKLDDAFQIDDSYQRVAQCLNVYCFRVRPKFLFPGLVVVAVNEIERNSEGWQILREEIVGAAIQT